MTPSSINIAIAKSRGWTCLPTAYSAGADWWYNAGLGLSQEFVPNYHGSLDAIQDAVLALPWDKQCAIAALLHEVCGSNQLNHVVHATAPQRCEAYIRALGLDVGNSEDFS